MKHISILLVMFLNTSFLFSQLNEGDIFSVDGFSYKIESTNLISNPGFEDGFNFWTDATSSANILNSSYFSLKSNGGIDNSKYIVGLKNESSSSAGSIGTSWSIEKNKKYYFSYYAKYENSSETTNNEEWCKVSLTNDRYSSSEPHILKNSTYVLGNSQWTKNEVIFENDSYNYLVARFRWLNNRLGFDDFALYEISDVINFDGLQSIINQAESLYDVSLNGESEFLISINSAKDFLISESSQEVSDAILMLETAIINFKIANASSENPLDFTFKINDNSFDNNANGWNGVGTVNMGLVEFYERKFDMNQTIKDLPEGKYVLKVQGFERSGFNDKGVAYNSGNENISALFYTSNDGYVKKKSLFNSLYKHTYNGAGSLNGFANNMTSAKNIFSDETKYEVVIENIIVRAGDDLIIGAKSDFSQSGYWVLFDNFRLEFQGEIDKKAFLVNINNVAEESALILSDKMQNSSRLNLENVLQQIKDLQESSSTLSELESLFISGKDAYKEAIESINLYKKLQAVLDEAEIVKSTFNSSKLQSLEAKLAIAMPLVDNLDATNTQLNLSVSELSNIVYKKIYIPTWMMGNVYDSNNNWSIERSKESRNWILFWEPGYGENPSTVADSNFRVDIDEILRVAELSFDINADVLKFIERGNSKTDNYKMIIRLRYTRDWEATGSGVDDTIGLLTLTAWSGQVAGHTLAHEVGHCFQYQTHCDNNNQNGWMYGFGTNAEGGNCWWEMCAQWQGFQVFPELQFTDSRFNNYLTTSHKHILHEAPRYDNFFIQDYWVYKHSIDIIGRLWNESKRPEDPVETYKRITNITQSQFNDEMFEQASRFATWDIPHLIANGTSKINQRAQTKMNKVDDDFWLVDASVCPENYGYNVIKLNVPTKDKKVTVFFEGKAGIDGFRKQRVNQAGWRFGFVALKNDGTRIYSEMGSANNINSTANLTFDCPDNVKQLWLVVSGAPSQHWRHSWDDDDSNDEQWPYQIKFNNTNLLGYQNMITKIDNDFYNDVVVDVIDKEVNILNVEYGAQLNIYDLQGRCVKNFASESSDISIVLNSGVFLLIIYKNSRIVTTRKIVIL